MRYIVAPKKFFPTAIVLRDSLLEITGEKFLVTNAPAGKEAIIVLGQAHRFGLINRPLLNNTLLVNICGNKELFSNTVIQMGMRTPTYHKILPTVFPVIIRKTLTGFGGQGMILCEDVEKFHEHWDRQYWWTKYIPMEKEFRAHVLGGEIKKVFKKVYTGETPEIEFPFRNANKGYRFSLIQHENSFKQLKLEVMRFWEALKIGHGTFALDVGWDGERYVWIEGNSIPGLTHNKNTCKMYAEYIADTLGLAK